MDTNFSFLNISKVQQLDAKIRNVQNWGSIKDPILVYTPNVFACLCARGFKQLCLGHNVSNVFWAGEGND